MAASALGVLALVVAGAYIALLRARLREVLRRLRRARDTIGAYEVLCQAATEAIDKLQAELGEVPGDD